MLCLLHLGYLFANLFSEASKWNAVTKSALLSILYPHINQQSKTLECAQFGEE